MRLFWMIVLFNPGSLWVYMATLVLLTGCAVNVQNDEVLAIQDACRVNQGVQHIIASHFGPAEGLCRNGAKFQLHIVRVGDQYQYRAGVFK